MRSQGLWEHGKRLRWLTDERYGADGKRLRMRHPGVQGAALNKAAEGEAAPLVPELPGGTAMAPESQ